MAKAKKQDECCEHHKMHKKVGPILIILGALILLNQYYSVVDWVNFWGIILVLLGLKHIIISKKHY